ncbi:MAG: FMN-binding protein [Polyangiales bacterium]
MKILLIIVGALLVLALPMTALMFYGMREVRELVIGEIDLTKLADGVYTGSYHKGRWTYDVEVTVRDHHLVSIVNTNTRMNNLKDWNQQAARAMLDKQSIHVDVVSGATLNTKAFRKAVELALSSPARP